MTEDPTPEIDLSDTAHIECPYKMYQHLHQKGGIGVDPNIGTVVAGYDVLAAVAKKYRGLLIEHYRRRARATAHGHQSRAGARRR